MNSKRIYRHFLKDMVNSIDKALEFTAGLNWNSFHNDEKTVFAVIRALEVLGEAAKSVPDDVRKR